MPLTVSSTGARAFGSVVAAALLVLARTANADSPTKQECIAASESAQVMRGNGALQAARKRFQMCVADACPGPVREDCSKQVGELDRAIPSVVFAFNDSGGAPISAVQIMMDGVALGDRALGAELEVDPGEHRFEFQAAGYTNAERRLAFRAGEKRRQEVIVLASTSKPVTPVVAPQTEARPAPQTDDTEPPALADGRGSGQRTLAYVLGGVGIVGLGLGTYFSLKAKGTYDDAVARCPSGPASCDQTGADGGADAHDQATVSTLAFLAGGALVATGVVLYLTAPKGGGVSLQPSAGLASAGLRLGGTW
jgi:hypothetical protein